METEKLFSAINEWIEKATMIEEDIPHWGRSREVIYKDNVEVHLSLKTRKLSDFGINENFVIKGIELVKIAVDKEFRRTGLSIRVVRELIHIVAENKNFGYFAVTEIINKIFEEGLKRHFPHILVQTEWSGDVAFYMIKDYSELIFLKEKPKKTRRIFEPPRLILF